MHKHSSVGNNFFSKRCMCTFLWDILLWRIMKILYEIISLSLRPIVQTLSCFSDYVNVFISKSYLLFDIKEMTI